MKSTGLCFIVVGGTCSWGAVLHTLVLKCWVCIDMFCLMLLCGFVHGLFSAVLDTMPFLCVLVQLVSTKRNKLIACLCLRFWAKQIKLHI